MQFHVLCMLYLRPLLFALQSRSKFRCKKCCDCRPVRPKCRELCPKIPPDVFRMFLCEETRNILQLSQPHKMFTPGNHVVWRTTGYHTTMIHCTQCKSIGEWSIGPIKKFTDIMSGSRYILQLSARW